VFSLCTAPVAGADPVTTACGLAVHVHDAAEVTARWLTRAQERVWFVHPAAGRIELLTGIEDPRLPRRGVEAFVPLPADAVVRALQAVSGIRPALAVDVFLLPMPPVATLGSFARRDCILLSPGLGTAPEEAIHPLVVHELGHVLEWAYLDPRPERWDDYRTARGLTDRPHDASAPHADRAREVLAEDVRVLFGGALARAGGTVENSELATPESVPGLADQLAGWFVGPAATPIRPLARAFPLPASGPVRFEWLLGAEGSLVAEVARAGAEAAVVEVHDLRGRRVRRTVGAAVANGRLVAGWDGCDERGRPAADGRYIFSIRVVESVATGAVMIIR